MGVNIENMAIIEQIFVDFAKKIEGSVWPANFLGVMQKSLIIFLGCILFKPAQTIESTSNEKSNAECVIVLHGLLRSSYSMKSISRALDNAGFLVWNESYPSRKKPIDELDDIAIKPGLEFCRENKAAKINFVTHSLGGIIVRLFLQEHVIDKLGKIVMLSPPNHGTKVVDYLKDSKIFKNIFGPAGEELGTTNGNILKKLKPIPGNIGIIVGNYSPNPWFSSIIPGADDGVVGVEDSKLPEMRDFLVVNYSHTFIMQRKAVIKQVVYFLKNGKFIHKSGVPDTKF